MELELIDTVDVSKFEKRIKEEINLWLIQRAKAQRALDDTISLMFVK